MRLWAVIRKKHKAIKDITVDSAHTGYWTEADLYSELEQVCQALDLSRPVILQKHTEDINRFSRTVFTKTDFIENVNFDRFEVELMDEKKADTPVYNPLYD